MRRAISTMVIALVAAVGVTGCQAIPTSGSVETGLADLSQAEQLVQFNPLGPVAGSSQEDIVRGFLLAASSSADDYAVAREFLSPGYAQQWDPSLEVLVDEGSRPFTSLGNAAGMMEVSALANVDADGELLPVMPGLEKELRFEFEEVGGEWRIASAPAGIVLDRATFTAIWSPHQLYFLGARDTLVSETRWYQSRVSLPTEIVSGLLAGPHLGDAVASAFPAGTELVGDNVPVVDGQARVELSSNVMDAGDDELATMHLQLRESLRTAPGVTVVEIYVGGTLVRLPEIEGEYTSTGPENTNPTLLIGDDFGVYTGGELEPIPGISEVVASANPDAITLSDNAETAAVRAANGITLLTEGGSLLVDSRSSLLEPSLDRFGYAWTYHGSSGELSATNAADQRIDVAAPWLDDLTPVAVRVSPDGGRIAALVPSNGGYSSILVAAITRDENGEPTGTSEAALSQMYASGSPVDFDWIDGLRFASLTWLGAAGKVTVGGPGLIPNEQGSVPEGVHIASGGSRAQLRVLTDDGDLYVSQGSGWQRALGDVRVLAKRD